MDKPVIFSACRPRAGLICMRRLLVMLVWLCCYLPSAPLWATDQAALLPAPAPWQQMSAAAARQIIAKAPVPAAVELDAMPRLLSQELIRSFNAQLRRQIQQALLIIYADDPGYMLAYRESQAPLSDDRIGPITLSWLNRFWFDFKLPPSGTLAESAVGSLLHFSQIVQRHPEWKTDLLSNGLGRWIDSFADAERARYYQIRLAGSDEQILAMLRLYHDDTDSQPKAEPDPDRALLRMYTYRLDASDFHTLALKAQVIDKLSALQDVVYLNQPLFDAAVRDALKDMGSLADSYLPTAREAAREQSYRLSLDSLQLLRERRSVPETVIVALERLNATYPNQAALIEAVLDVVPQTQDNIDQYLPDIVEVAETSSNYVLTARALSELRSSGKYVSVPVLILEMLRGLQGLEYPQRWLFDKAVLARLRQALGACTEDMPGSVTGRRKISQEQLQELGRVLNDPALFAGLVKLWQGKACNQSGQEEMQQLLQSWYAKYLSSIRDSARKQPRFFPDKPVVWNGEGCGCVLDELSGQVVGFYPFWLAGSQQRVDFSTLRRIAYYGATFDDRGLLVQANDGRDFVESAISGLLAQHDFVANARRHQTQVDWVIQRNDWRSWRKLDKNARELVLQRLRANIIKLLSIRQRDWTAQLSARLPFGQRFVPTNGDGVTLFFDDYPDDDIAVALFNDFITRLRQELRQAGEGDAINIMMRQTALGSGIFSYANLAQLINVAERDPNPDWLARIDRNPKRLPLLLVLIGEETSVSKKTLRNDMELALRGQERKLVLRQTVPVITFDQDNWPQLEDDIIYFKENFGGIGFWTMPLVNTATTGDASGRAESAGGAGTVLPTDAPGLLAHMLSGASLARQCEAARDISQCLVDFYQEKPGNTTSAVCKTVCENLYVFRMSFKLSLLMFLGCAAVYFTCCSCRETMARYYHLALVLVFLLSALLGLALLFCDPFLNWLAGGHMIPIFLVLFIIALIVWYQYQLKEKDEQP